jgi:hypothetical protein
MQRTFDAFPSADAAAKALADFSRRFAFPCVDSEPDSIARDSADSAWIKPLTRRQAGRAEAYLRWASANIPKMAKSAKYVINQDQFDILVRRTGADLLRAWREYSPDKAARLSYGAAFRIVDQLFKAIDESESCRHESVRQFLHVPLEGSTIKPLRLIVDELLDTDFSLEIPATIYTGFVATEEQYVLLQGAISALARRAGISPILYAYWCARP